MTPTELSLSRRLDAMQLEMHAMYVSLDRCHTLVFGLIDLCGMPRESPNFADAWEVLARARDAMRNTE